MDMVCIVSGKNTGIMNGIGYTNMVVIFHENTGRLNL